MDTSFLYNDETPHMHKYVTSKDDLLINIGMYWVKNDLLYYNLSSLYSL